jgi:hypothetical protein
MLKFPAQDRIEVYVSLTGHICISSQSENPDIPERVISLTIGQFRTILKNADELIKEADSKKKGSADAQ